MIIGFQAIIIVFLGRNQLKFKSRRPERFSAGERTWIKVNKIRDCDLYADYARAKSPATGDTPVNKQEFAQEFAWVLRMTMSRADGFIRWVINNMQVRLVLKDPIIAKESRICELARGGRESS